MTIPEAELNSSEYSVDVRVLVLSIGQRQRKRGHTGRVVSGQGTKRLVWRDHSSGPRGKPEPLG